MYRICCLLLGSLFAQFNLASPLVIDKSNVHKLSVENISSSTLNNTYLIELEDVTTSQELEYSLRAMGVVEFTAIGQKLALVKLTNDRQSTAQIQSLVSTNGVKRLIANTEFKPERRGSIKSHQAVNHKTNQFNQSNDSASYYSLKTFSSAFRTDLYFPTQWALENTGQAVRAIPGEPGVDTGAVHAWQTTEGLSDGVVAIFGDSIDDTHEDLTEALWVNQNEIPGNGVDDDANGYIDDVLGANTIEDNGNVNTGYKTINTAMAGIIAADMDNDIGISGITRNDKVLTCQMINDFGQTSIEAISKCFAYIIDLKTNHNVNVHSIIVTWGFYDLYVENYAWLQSLVESLIPYDIFVIAPVRQCDYICWNIDRKPDIPASFESPNLIAVTASTSHNFLTSGSSGDTLFAVGYRSVHVAAPGNQVISTLSGFMPEFDSSSAFFFDDFETDKIEQWTSASASFEISNERSKGGIKSLKVIPNSDTGDVELLSDAFDLRQVNKSTLGVSYWTFRDEDFDPGAIGWPIFMYLVYADGTTNPLSTLQSYVSPNWLQYTYNLHIPQIIDEKTPEQLAEVRIKLKINAETDDAVFVDNFAVAQWDEESVSNRYGFLQGSVSSAAHIAASISLIKQARPELSNVQIKNLLMSTGSQFQDWISGENEMRRVTHTISNRAIKVSSNDENSVLTCNNMPLTRRFFPKSQGRGLLVSAHGFKPRLSVISTNCDSADQAPNVTANGVPIYLNDNGVDGDRFAQDGVFSGLLEFEELSDTTVTVENDPHSTLTYRNLTPYNSAEVIDYEWLEPNGDDFVEGPFNIHPDFPVNIGNVKDDHVPDEQKRFFSASGFGLISIDYFEIKDFLYEEIEPKTKKTINARGKIDDEPTNSLVANFPENNHPFRIVIAPFLRSYYRVDISDYIFRRFTLGEAPNRKWVLTYYNVREFECTEQEAQEFQLVLNETSGDIQFNYKKVGETCNSYDPGVGILIGKDFKVVYTDKITDEMSLKFSLPHNNVRHINQTPEILRHTPIARLEQLERLEIDLSEYFYDFDDSVLNYEISTDEEGEDVISISGITFEDNLMIIESREIIDDVFFLNAIDSGGLSVNTTFWLEIRGRPPTKKQDFEDLLVYVDEPYSIDLGEYFDDNIDEVLVYQLDIDASDYQIDGNILTFNFSEPGDHLINIVASDLDGFSVESQLSLSAVINTPPYLRRALGEHVIPVGFELTIVLDTYFSDEHDDSLQYQVSGLPDGFTFDGSEIRGSSSVSGRYTFNVIASDSLGLTVEANGVIEVQAAAQNPPADPASNSSGGGGGGSFAYWMLLMLIAVSARCKFILRR